MTTSARYSPGAAAALALLKGKSNDIDIFVEDVASPNMWVRFIRRLLPPRTKLQSVTALGPRDVVLEACRMNQGQLNRPTLFIIDGDLDIALGLPKPRLRNLYRLRRYCVENYFIDEDAIVEAVISLDPKVRILDVVQSISLMDWITKNELLLSALFTCYAVLHCLGTEKQTVAYSPHRLFADGESYNFCREKVRSRVLKLYRGAVKQHGIESVRRNKSRLQENVSSLTILEFVSAKKYLLLPIFEIVKRNTRVNCSLEVFKLQLAGCCATSVDPYLKRRLSQVVRG